MGFGDYYRLMEFVDYIDGKRVDMGVWSSIKELATIVRELSNKYDIKELINGPNRTIPIYTINDYMKNGFMITNKDSEYLMKLLADHLNQSDKMHYKTDSILKNTKTLKDTQRDAILLRFDDDIKLNK